MKTMKRIFMGLLAVALLASCTKNQKTGVGQNATTTAQGRLLDAATLEPIAGGKITLWRGGIKFKDTLSAADGSYRFEFPTQKGYLYKLSATADQYLSNYNIGAWLVEYSSGRPTPIAAVYAGEDNRVDIKLPPLGYVEYHFKHVEPYSGNIEVRFSPYNQHVISWNGQGINRTYTAAFPGGTTYRIGYAILRDGQLHEQHYDTLFIPRFDTLYYPIEY